MTTSDGSTADYYELPDGATQLQDLISHRDMNAQLGEIFRAAYRYGMASHSGKLRDAKKIKFYIDAEIRRLEKLETVKPGGFTYHFDAMNQKPEAHPIHPAMFDHVDPADVEIASAIEDDSERMQAIGQNGNGGEHYSSERPSFAFAPPWAKWVAQDKNGEWTYFEGMPVPFANGWASSSRNVVISQCRCELPGNDDWTSTLTARPAN